MHHVLLNAVIIIWFLNLYPLSSHYKLRPFGGTHPPSKLWMVFNSSSQSFFASPPGLEDVLWCWVQFVLGCTCIVDRHPGRSTPDLFRSKSSAIPMHEIQYLRGKHINMEQSSSWLFEHLRKRRMQIAKCPPRRQWYQSWGLRYSYHVAHMMTELMLVRPSMHSYAFMIIYVYCDGELRRGSCKLLNFKPWPSDLRVLYLIVPATHLHSLKDIKSDGWVL